MIRLPRSTIIAALSGVLALSFGMAYYQSWPLDVGVVQPERDLVIKVFGLGTVEARILAKVGFKASGTLTELNADHGDRVKAGQALARIGNSEQSTRLDKARAQIQIAGL